MTPQWVAGNRIELLENGEEFFPAVFSAIEAARREVLLETFILHEDKVGLALLAVLCNAARRGVSVDVTVDGYGSAGLSSSFVQALGAAGVRLHVFDPRPLLFGRLRTNPFRRLHRKVAVIDGEIGFVGGINFSADHLADFGPLAKQDYAVRVRGPIVQAMWRLARETLAPAHGGRSWFFRHREEPAREPAPMGDGEAMLVVRDNHEHRDDVERHYRRALHAAQREVIIANAYFFPGYRLLRAMRRAAQRGVDVRLILQGQPDMPWAAFLTRMLYDHLMSAGVRIHEYCTRPMHGKVALVDDNWATVGSSNLEPLSLWFNLEANLVIRDRAFNRQLRERLQHVLREHCEVVDLKHAAARRWWWRLGLGTLAFHVLRHMPSWAAALPAHRPRLTPANECGITTSSTEAAVQPWQWRQESVE
jgi:cardiolipin synthase A/B